MGWGFRDVLRRYVRGPEDQESEGSEDAFLRMETQTDYFGGFDGYKAGYDTLGTAPLRAN